MVPHIALLMVWRDPNTSAERKRAWFIIREPERLRWPVVDLRKDLV